MTVWVCMARSNTFDCGAVNICVITTSYFYDILIYSYLFIYLRGLLLSAANAPWWAQSTSWALLARESWTNCRKHHNWSVIVAVWPDTAKPGERERDIWVKTVGNSSVGNLYAARWIQSECRRTAINKRSLSLISCRKISKRIRLEKRARWAVMLFSQTRLKSFYDQFDYHVVFALARFASECDYSLVLILRADDSTEAEPNLDRVFVKIIRKTRKRKNGNDYLCKKTAVIRVSCSSRRIIVSSR